MEGMGEGGWEMGRGGPTDAAVGQDCPRRTAQVLLPEVLHHGLAVFVEPYTFVMRANVMCPLRHKHTGS